MANVMRALQPGLEITITAQTAKKTLVRYIIADESSASDTTFEVDNGQRILSAIPPGPSTFGPISVDLSSPSGLGTAQAGYFRTSPEIEASTGLATKITDALRRAEDWGWSYSLANVKRFSIANKVISHFLSKNKRSAMAPPPELAFLFGLGNVFLVESEVSNRSVNNLAKLLIHESLHRSLYSIGYSVRLYAIPNVGPYEQLWDATAKFLGAGQWLHHLGTSLALVVNVTNLGESILGPSPNVSWPDVGRDVDHPDNLVVPVAPPDLRAHSEVDTSSPPHTQFGDRLDAVASIVHTWGIGGWVDDCTAKLNYINSGVFPSLGSFSFDLSQSDVSLAWALVGNTMLRTAEYWSSEGKISASDVPRATGMGMTILMAKLGLLPKK